MEQKKAFADAIEDEYYFEMFIDDLPMYGYIGEVRTTACLPAAGLREGSHSSQVATKRPVGLAAEG